MIMMKVEKDIDVAEVNNHCREGGREVLATKEEEKEGLNCSHHHTSAAPVSSMTSWTIIIIIIITTIILYEINAVPQAIYI